MSQEPQDLPPANEAVEESKQDDSTTESTQAVQSQPKKSKYLKRNYQYCKNYDDINQIVKSFPALQTLIVPLDVDNIQNALCYVIRSNNDDDVHKAIKYGIWTSVPGNNIKLSAAYENSQKLGVEVYLFFSVVKSGQFTGVARLKSSFQEETFSYWWQPHKFKGHFKIEWIYIKDVKQKQFEGLKNSQGDDISRSKDCTELNFESTGKKMLQIYKDAPSQPSIFKFFKSFDSEEQGLRQHYSYMSSQNNANRNNYGDNSHFNNILPPNQNAYYNSRGQHFQAPVQMNGMYPYPFYPQVMFNQQFFQQPGLMQQQYTPEQLQSFQNLCETHIYPPNTSFPHQNGKNNRQHKRNHNSHGNGNRNYKKEKSQNNQVQGKAEQVEQPKEQQEQVTQNVQTQEQKE